MLLTMAVGSSSILAVAVSAPDSAPDIGVRATYVGLFTGFVYFVSMFTGSFCTGLIVRYGPIRVLQVTALFSILGLVAFTFASPPSHCPLCDTARHCLRPDQSSECTDSATGYAFRKPGIHVFDQAIRRYCWRCRCSTGCTACRNLVELENWNTCNRSARRGVDLDSAADARSIRQCKN